MSRTKVTDFYIYRWRYIIGFVVIVGGLIGLLLATLHVPGGVSKSEMQSVVVSTSTSSDNLLGKDTSRIEHLPYHALQHLSVKTLGVSELSIKLPSLILSFASVALLYGLLRLWFRRNVAVITCLIIVATGQFLLMSQLGTPLISYLFLSTALLFSASMIARTNRFAPFWLITASAVGALCLYSPLGIYVILALAITCMVHPHARFLILKQPLWAQITSLVLFVILAAPLLIAIAANPSLLIVLSGFDAELSSISWPHIKDTLGQYVGFDTPANSEILRPAYGITTMLLALLGLYRLFSARYTAKSYILTIWIVTLIPLIIFHESTVAFALVPLVLLIAFAIDYLIRSWYGLFPRNPYARVAGLLPLGVLIVGLTLSNIEHFFYGYHYSPSAASTFTKDVRLLNMTLNGVDQEKVTLIVSQDNLKFYQAFNKYYRGTHKLMIIGPSQKSTGTTITTDAPIKKIPDQIITTNTANNAARFYLYKNGVN